MSEEDIAAKRGLGYAKSIDDALAMVDEAATTSPSSCARPRSSRSRRSPTTGETMPPKSTYFFPKVITGFVFNPVG